MLILNWHTLIEIFSLPVQNPIITIILFEIFYFKYLIIKYFITEILKKGTGSSQSTQYLIEKGLVVFWTLYDLNFTLSNKFFSLLGKLQNEKQWLEPKTKIRRYYFSAVWISCIFGWRYDTEVRIDRQLCDEGMCRWMFKVIDLIGERRERAVDSVYASISRSYRYYSPPHAPWYLFCVDKQTLSAIFFLFYFERRQSSTIDVVAETHMAIPSRGNFMIRIRNI